MWWQRPHNPTAYDDDWEDQPAQGPFYQWGLGLLLPLALAGYSAYVIAMQQLDIGGRYGSPVLLTGVNAIALSLAIFSAAVFIHCHYFWGNIYDQVWFAVLGKIIAGCGFIAGLVVVLVRNGLFGINS